MTKNGNLPADYEARVYAGWLGKCIGVRFGAPLESWTYEDIRDNLGELEWYVREDAGKVFKPDDDTAVPMVLIRALEDYGVSPSAEQFGDTLLNYLGDQHGTLWWGGYGVSTEHTAYLNLANGIPAPRSGSIAQNGAAVAEQIGGQIFSDIWGLVAPNNPALAADLAERAASVTHDGNGIHGGRFIAALVSAAFSERDPRRLIEIGLSHIPADSEYARVIRAMLTVYAECPDDWRAAFANLKTNFGYDRYPGVVHIIPNAGVVALGLLYGEGDFSRTIRITNMCGWDTDCNVGNVGAITGVAVGVEGIDSRWREPMNDLLITASIIGVRNILTIPQCVDLFCALGRQLAGERQVGTPPHYHFRYPGATSNFLARGERARPIHLQQGRVGDQPALCAAIRNVNRKGEVRLFTRTYYRTSELSGNGYGATFSPLVYPGQQVQARVRLAEDVTAEIRAALYVYDDNAAQHYQAQATLLKPGEWQVLTYTIPALTDACLSEVGVALRTLDANWEVGSIAIAELDWSGPPAFKTTFARERRETNTISQWTRLRGYWRIEDGAYHGSGPDCCESYTGDLAWKDYRVSVELVPIIGDHHGINVRVRGALRSYAVGLAPDGRVALYKKDREYCEIASVPFAWMHGEAYRLSITARGADLAAEIVSVNDGGHAALHWRDDRAPYLSGQVGLSTWNGGHTRFLSFEVQPANEA